LVSNDRNEIVPLFYLQAVEGTATALTGLFPLIKPGADFSDIGATLDTALRLGGSQPIFLIKPMPGLEAKYALEPAQEPLVRVTGPAAIDPPAQIVDAPYGPLHLLGYDWQPSGDGVAIKLYWRVDSAPASDYTTTVQLFDLQGEKLAQDDHPPGGRFYPTSLWKVGETLVDRHQLMLPAGAQPVRILVAMYHGPALTPLAAPLEIRRIEP
jgi:hypothetical protein